MVVISRQKGCFLQSKLINWYMQSNLACFTTKLWDGTGYEYISATNGQLFVCSFD